MTSIDIYPVLPLRDLVMFPNMIVPLFVGREKSVKALEEASVLNKNKILLLAQKDANRDDPKTSDLYKVGVIANVLQVLKLQDSTVKILVEGVKRVKVIKFLGDDNIIRAHVKDMNDRPLSNENKEVSVLQRSITDQFESYTKLNRRTNPEVAASLSQIQDIHKFCDAISAHLIIKADKKQEILELTDVSAKLEKLLLILDSEIELLNTETRIRSRVRTQIEKNQKDYYLNEQLKAIHKELGEEDFKEEIGILTEKLKKLKLSKEAKERVDSELRKLKTMNPMSSETTVIRNYLEWIIDLPWGKYSPIKKDLKNAEKVLEDEHYGLEKIKERILEYLAVNLRTNDLKSPIVCLVGPPGVGKTSLAKSIANATGRNFVKISLGGLRDEAEIKGHRRTYIGAMPGKIIQAMKKAKTNNPLILLDEIDKLGFDHRGDPSSALLEVLDPEQNHLFNDHYIELDYDLSKVMFVATANSTDIPRPLMDRMEVIRLSGYTEDEKVQIAKNYLIPKQFKAHGIKPGEVEIPEEVIREVIYSYTREAGVRSLDREIAKISRKAIREIMLKKIDTIKITLENVNNFLGVKKFLGNELEKEDIVGVTTGLAYTEVGGDILSIEAVLMYGKGDIKITGKLGDVMKESAQAALSYVRSRAVELGINPGLFKRRDIHIHVPEGATPKDGPSAGIALYTSLVSALTGIPVRKTVAMTGEITLRGRVLAIGGLKEKLLAALRAGVKTVMIPKENTKDLEEIPANVKDNLEIIPVENADEVLKIALTKTPEPIEWDEDVERSEEYGKRLNAQTFAH
ncbi:endopeptidase La [Holosporaceae bacterium 'Namur']|nr:endopeptidase La [Holosporaceae bacterium 'Namur']